MLCIIFNLINSAVSFRRLRHSVDNGCDLPNRFGVSAVFQDIMNDLYFVKIRKYNRSITFFASEISFPCAGNSRQSLNSWWKRSNRNKIVPAKMFIRIRCCNNRNDPIDHLVCTEKYLMLFVEKSQLSKGMSFQIYCFKWVVTVMQYNSRCYGLIKKSCTSNIQPL